MESIAGRLRDITVRGVSVHVDEWVVTPEGEQPVDIVVRGGDRSVAILVDRRYERDIRTLDALRLVYGRFDTLYRLSRNDTSESINDTLYAIACEKRRWFTLPGCLDLLRGASSATRLD
ncbi:MAG: hypothetical protein HKN17_07900, partial [Rhodothermales bacterium]|nr:hypothetical protein [Rhodothermales bacterium]